MVEKNDNPYNGLFIWYLDNSTYAKYSDTGGKQKISYIGTHPHVGILDKGKK